MNDRQIEIGTKLLEFISKNGQVNTDEYFHYLKNGCGFNTFEDEAQIGLVKSHLIRLKLVEVLGDGDYFIANTIVGNRVNKMGLRQYLSNETESPGSAKNGGTVKDKKDRILTSLYEKKYDGMYHSVLEILGTTHSEAFKLASALENDGLIKVVSSKDSVDAEITTAGVEWIEDNGHTDYAPQDPISESERKILIQKIDELAQRLSRLEHGQDIIYTDIDKHLEEVKTLLNVLGKKNWVQVLTGGLLEAGLGEISPEVKEVLIDTFKDIKLLQ
jgi:hypothetical protein